jgi:DNA-binding NarL/FixJ family response regulator
VQAAGVALELLLARGLPNREIGARLHLTARTVEKHVERLMGKTRTTRRTQLVALMTRVAGPHRRR